MIKLKNKKYPFRLSVAAIFEAEERLKKSIFSMFTTDEDSNIPLHTIFQVTYCALKAGSSKFDMTFEDFSEALFESGQITTAATLVTQGLEKLAAKMTPDTPKEGA